METKTYTLQEIAEILKISEITIYRYIKKGKIKAIKIGKKWRIKSEELERILKDGIKI